MFYKQVTSSLSQVTLLKRPFIQNIALILIFCLFSILGTQLKPESNLAGLFLILSMVAILTNLVFLYLVQKQRKPYAYYLLWGLGGFFSSIILAIGSFEMMGWSFVYSGVFWSFCIASLIVLIIIYTKNFDEKFFRSNLQIKGPTYYWNITYDISSHESQKYGCLVNFLRIVIAPLSPALGMAVSRNYENTQEWFLGGLMLLILSSIVSIVMIKYCVLGCKFLAWQRMLGSDVKIIDE